MTEQEKRLAGGQTQNIMEVCEDLNDIAHACEVLGLDNLGRTLRMKSRLIKTNADSIYLMILNKKT